MLTPTGRVLLGVVAGFLVGLAAPAGAVSRTMADVLAPIGAAFVNLIRMTAIPLIASMLVATLGRARASASVRRVALRGLLIAAALIVVAASATLVIARTVLARVDIDRAAALALQGSGSATRAEAQSLAAWLGDLVPPNIIKAAADGSLVPVIIFAGLFGVALSHVDGTRRDSVLRVVEGVAEAMQRIVGWILLTAPIGVFALAVPLASRLGMAAAGAVVVYILLVVVLTVATIALLVYPVGLLAGQLRMAAFVAACAPVQSIAFAARSSLAALPVMVDSAERAGLTSDGARFVLPLAGALFHFGTAVAQPAGALFLARLYGVELTSAQLGIMVIAVLVASFAVPGVPGGSIIGMVPVLAAVNLPLEGIGILLAVDAIPDMFRTLANATGAMMLTIVAHAGAPADQAGAPTGRPM